MIADCLLYRAIIIRISNFGNLRKINYKRYSDSIIYTTINRLKTITAIMMRSSLRAKLIIKLNLNKMLLSTIAMEIIMPLRLKS